MKISPLTLLILLYSTNDISFAIRWPTFNWDTVPVFYMACNSSGPLNDEAIKYIGKFPMVCIDQGQGVINGTNKTYNNLYQEDKILSALKQIKQYNSSITTIFYYNSVLDWDMFYLNILMNNVYNDSWHLRDSNNITVQIPGDHEFPQPSNGMYVFDFIQQNVRNKWVQECINMTKTGYVDGCFLDRAGANSFDGYNFTQQRIDEYHKGHDAALLDVQSYLNKTNHSVAIMNNYVIDGVIATMIPGFKPAQERIKLLMNYSERGILVQAHANSGCDNITDSLAAFLIGANKYSYYACSTNWKYSGWNVWHNEYDKPLGEPLGAAVLNGNVYLRRFAHGTNVTFDINTNHGTIQWGEWKETLR